MMWADSCEILPGPVEDLRVALEGLAGITPCGNATVCAVVLAIA